MGTSPVYAGQRVTALALDEGIPLAAYKAGSQSSGANNSTLFNDSDLVVQLDANAVYRWTCELWYTGTNTPGDLQLQWAAPAGAAGGWSGEWFNTSGTLSFVLQQPYGASGNVALGGDGTSPPNQRPAWMKGVIAVSGTPGSLQLQWAQNSNSGTATVVLAYSNLMAWRIG